MRKDEIHVPEIEPLVASLLLVAMPGGPKVPALTSSHSDQPFRSRALHLTAVPKARASVCFDILR